MVEGIKHIIQRPEIGMSKGGDALLNAVTPTPTPPPNVMVRKNPHLTEEIETTQKHIHLHTHTKKTQKPHKEYKK